MDPLAGWHDSPALAEAAAEAEKSADLLSPHAVPAFVIELRDLNAGAGASLAPSPAAAAAIAAAEAVHVLLHPSALLPHEPPLAPSVVFTPGGAPEGRVDVDTTFLREFLPPDAPADGNALVAWLGAAAPLSDGARRFVFCVTVHQRGVDTMPIDEACAGYIGPLPGSMQAKAIDRAYKARPLPPGYAARAPTLRVEAVYEMQAP